MPTYRMISEMLYYPASDLTYVPSNLQNLNLNYVKKIEDDFVSWKETTRGSRQLEDLYAREILKDPVEKLHPVVKAHILFLSQFSVGSIKYRLQGVVDKFIEHSNVVYKVQSMMGASRVDEEYIHFALSRPALEDAEYYSASPLKGFLFNVFTAIDNRVQEGDGAFSFRIYEAYKQPTKAEQARGLGDTTVYVAHLAHINPSSRLIGLKSLKKIMGDIWRDVLRYSDVDKNKAIHIHLNSKDLANLKYITKDLSFDSRYEFD